MKHVYLGYDNPRQAFYLPDVLVLCDEGNTRVLLGADARDAMRQFSDLSHHLCGVRDDPASARLLASQPPDPHRHSAYNVLYNAAWWKGTTP